ncbi:CBS domain-containing protein [Streptomyces sp. NPDC005931]|uniref:CBS domain-containing protein n=1 Tax=Streptomyces sp. NPDC005931 TaxID=3364737 RepID=UPI0036A6BCFE
MHGSPHIVSDVMTRTVVALAGGAMFKDIVETMEEWAVSAMPVLDGEGKVIGVVSEADLLRKEEYRDSVPERPAFLRRLPDLDKAAAVTAEELMTAPAVTVHADATIAEATRIMARHRVKRLPVVDDTGALEGVVSRTDLLKVFLRADDDIADEIRGEVVAGRFPASLEAVDVQVRDGVVTMTGHVPDASLVPVAVRLLRAVEGVVDVRCELTGPHGRPALDPDFPDDRPPGPSAGA